MSRFTPEKAAELLGENPNMPVPIKKYFEHVIDDTLKDFYAIRFNNLVKIHVEERDNLGSLVYDAGTDGFRYARNGEPEITNGFESTEKANYISLVKHSIIMAIEDEVLILDDEHGVKGLGEHIERFLKRDFPTDGNYTEDQLLHTYIMTKFVNHYFRQKTESTTVLANVQ